MNGRAAASGVVYVAPALLLNLALYWHGYHAWFQQDDFAWLGLWQMAGTWSDLPRLLFEPMAQGTIRPISERLFFLAFRALFDLDGRPYHALVFVTQSANLVLLYLLARQLGATRKTASGAALIWCSNSVLAWPLAWVSAYNQVLLACCFLGAANAFARYGATGERRWLALTWTVYLAGFGVLETNVVFPGLALGYAVIRARPLLRPAAWLAAPAVLFAAVHTLVAAKPREGIYAIDASPVSMVRTLGRYVYLMVWPADSRHFINPPAEAAMLAAVLACALAIGWAIAARRDRLAAFGTVWFLIAVSIYLVVPGHICDYYLTVPAIGASLALAAALGRAPRWTTAVLLLCLVPYHWAGTWRFTIRTRATGAAWKELMNGVAAAQRRHPGQTIYLEGVDPYVLSVGFTDRPFRLLGSGVDVKLPPEEARRNLAPQWLDGAEDPAFTLPPAIVARGLELGQAAVLRHQPGQGLTDVTASYLRTLARDPAAMAAPARVAVAEPAYAFLLGRGWHTPENGYRWTTREAELRVGAPSGAREVRVRGFCAPAQLSQGPLELTISTESTAATTALDSCAGTFEVAAPLRCRRSTPEGELTVRLSVSRTQVFPPDRRELGLGVVAVEVR